MNVFEIKKVPLGKNFTGVNTEALGQAMGCLTQNGIRLYTYLIGNKDGFRWTVNPTVFAEWLGWSDSANDARKARKTIENGIANLMENGYLKKVSEEGHTVNYIFYENGNNKVQERNVPKNDIKNEWGYA